VSSQFKIAVLISGSGTTLRNFVEKSEAGRFAAEISLVISSNPDAPGLQHAEVAGIPTSVVDRKRVPEPEFSQQIFQQCREAQVDLVVMGGFLRKLTIADDFENRVINIHPSLIPAFCGKGNYGIRVHRAAVKYGVKLSGCTVHFVDNEYDHGPIIAQRSVSVSPEETAENLAKKIFVEECQLYPEIINQFSKGNVTYDGRVVTVKQ
jgi:phosphoribosylglycinamide formyltransferase-1